MTPNIDELIVDPRTYAQDELFHRLLSEIRHEDPVHRVEVEGYTPFWLVSKHADIMEVEKQNERFINDPLLTLTTTEALEKTKEFTGGSHLLLRTLVHMDNPDHRAYRALTQAWFMPPNLKKLDDKLSGLAREFVDKMEAKGGECDFVTDVAMWYPLRVIMTILGVDRKDEARMLALTQELFGAQDPDTQRGGGFDDLMATITDFFQFFTALTAERRANPRDDVASVIANATLDGKPIGDLEAMSYYIIVATAGHDTTSSTTAGGLKALIENPDELAKLRANPALLASAVDEMIRWVTPVKHFMRTATEDYVLRDKTIRKGDHLMMMYPSGNRDEEVFDEPFKFKVDRSPNRHLAFGYGAHLCLGQHLAKMEIKALYAELLARFDSFEITGEHPNVQASFVSGLKRLPIRYAARPQAA
ncbi:MAG: cytochrome P450 [Parvibaculaceae bacterium]|nr:cytochrome P450 [Parvibaculaceae bacterium]